MSRLSEASSTGTELEIKTVLKNPAIPWKPTEKQAVWLRDLRKELLVGGAAGGGKTAYMLMAGLQFIQIEGYSAIIFRRTYPELRMEGSLIPLSKQFLSTSPAQWNGTEKTWRWPGGGTLAFGHLQYDDSVYSHQSAEYQFIGFDEAGNFTPHQLKYLRSRLRKKKDFWVPLRYRLTANPGGTSHDYLKREYINSEDPSVKGFIPATIEDNPHLDTTEYKKNLMDLPPVERKRLLEGDWQVQKSGQMFKREWFDIVDKQLSASHADRLMRFWDLAGTKDDGSYTCGVKIAVNGDNYFIVDVCRGQWSPGARDKIISQKAKMDGPETVQVFEQEGGSGGKAQIESIRNSLSGSDVRSHNPTGNKKVRAGPFASQCEIGNVYLVDSKWNEEYINEFVLFPESDHSDQVDATSGAFNWYHTDNTGSEKKAGIWGYR